jgi:hypothetical protein
MIPVSARLSLGLGMSADTLLRRQSYVASGDKILVIPRLQGTITGVVEISL